MYNQTLEYDQHMQIMQQLADKIMDIQECLNYCHSRLVRLHNSEIVENKRYLEVCNE